jgi:hypothetical protein
MRLGGEPVGRWGIVLLAVTGIAGLLLAWHGWAGRAAAVTPSLAGGSTAGSPAASAAATGTASAARPAGPSPAATRSPAPAASAGPSAPAAAGPLLSSEPYASSAFQVWPGPMSAVASQAMTGLTISVHKVSSGLSVTAGVSGQPPAAPHVYAGGAKVYVVEASMGDDSGNADYSLGDDGLVVTDAKGRIVR